MRDEPFVGRFASSCVNPPHRRAWLFFSLPFRGFSGLHCWNAAAAHLASANWSYYDHRLPWRDPNEDAEDACFASCCFQSGHRWVRHISNKPAHTCYESHSDTSDRTVSISNDWLVAVHVTARVMVEVEGFLPLPLFYHFYCLTVVRPTGAIAMLPWLQPNLQVISVFRSWETAWLTIRSALCSPENVSLEETSPWKRCFYDIWCNEELWTKSCKSLFSKLFFINVGVWFQIRAALIVLFKTVFAW